MRWAAKNIVKKTTSRLIPYERNPKEHPEDQISQIAASITEWGWTVPIIIDQGDNVLAGHGRLYAAQKLGIEEVPCIVAEGWSDEQKRAYVIADNKIQENANWDFNLLAEEINSLSDAGYDLSSMGISETDIELLSKVGSDEEFNFDFNESVNESPSYNEERSEPKKTTEGYVEFALVMQEENKIRLMAAIKKVKADNSIESNEDALIIILNKAGF